MQKIILIFFLLSSLTYAAMIEVLPTSYVFDQATDVGSYTYHDETGRQLIDGYYGVAPWSANLGNGPAYEWVGWCNDSIVNIDFDFTTAKQVNMIKIGTTQDNLDDVVIPSFRIYSSNDKTSWSFVKLLDIPENNAYNNVYYTATFSNLNITSRYIRVAAVFSSNGPWTFLDEVDFYQDTTIPEPATIFLIGVAFLFSFLKKRVAI